MGSTKRAMLLSEYLDPPDQEQKLFEVESDRGFLTITGLTWFAYVSNTVHTERNLHHCCVVPIHLHVLER